MARSLSLLIPLICLLGGAAEAETAPVDAVALTDDCPLLGPLNGATPACRDRRIAYRAEIAACMDQMHAEADRRAGKPTKVNSHTNRARIAICDAAVRETLGLSTD